MCSNELDLQTILSRVTFWGVERREIYGERNVNGANYKYKGKRHKATKNKYLRSTTKNYIKNPIRNYSTNYIKNYGDTQ